jgi:hypothetical protein
MSKFFLSVWMSFEAEDYDEAHEKASKIEDQIAELVSYVEDIGAIDVEQIDE